MPLRQLQIHLPISRKEEMDEFLEGKKLPVLWCGVDEPGWGLMTILVLDAFEVDPVVHGLMELFAGEEHFRLVLAEAMATYPRPTEMTEVDDEPAAEDATGAPEETGREEPNDEEQEQESRTRSRVAIEELEERLRGDAAPTGTFMITVLLSAIVAALGLSRNNTAVVIGAMVIAPLLGPNMALALGTTLGKWSLIRGALRTNAIGLFLALTLAMLLGLVPGLDVSTAEILSRTEVGYTDIALALASGVAGAIAVTTGVPAALVGVMVAVALMPPLVTTGLLFGAGDFSGAAHAALLTAVNVIAVNLAAVGTFAIKGIGPRSYWEKDSAVRMTRTALGIWLTLIALLAALVWVTL
ncbi:MAG: TIGR00341 family protein [Sumerlaeia bacterium]